MLHTNDQRGISIPLIVAIIAVIAIGVSLVFISNTPRSTDTPTNEAMMEKKDDAMVEKKDDAMMEADDTKAMEDTSTDTMMKDDEGTKDDTKKDESMMQSARTGYITYSSQAFAEAKDQKRVLFFHATWCPTCKISNESFEKNVSRIPSNVVVFKTDYDSESALKTQYGITYQHTFVLVDADGNAVTKWNGGGIDELLTHVL